MPSNRNRRRNPATDTPADDTSVAETPAVETPATPDVPTTDDATPTETPQVAFRRLFVTVASDPDAGDRDSMMTAYRAIPGAGGQRSVALNDAMMDAMTNGADRNNIVTVTNYVRDNATVRPTRTQVDPRTIAAIRWAAFRVVSAELPELLNIPADDVDTITDMAQDPTFMTDHDIAIRRVGERIVDAITRGTGQRGETTRRRADDVQGSAAVQHVVHCMSTVDPGTFLSTGQMAKMSSPAYPSTHPSAGHLANVCRRLVAGSDPEILNGPNYVGTMTPSIGAIRTDDATDDDA